MFIVSCYSDSLNCFDFNPSWGSLFSITQNPFNKFPYCLSLTDWFITYNQNPLSDMCYGTKNTPKALHLKGLLTKAPFKRELELFLLRLKSLYSIKMTLTAHFVILKIVRRLRVALYCEHSVAFLSLLVCFFFSYYIFCFENILTVSSWECKSCSWV